MSVPGAYGARAIVGVLTPQANHAAEAEISVLLEPDVSLATARLRHGAPKMLDRLKGYADSLADALDSMPGMPIDACAFACTGTSYVFDDIGLDFEETAAAMDGPPIVSAAAAIEAALSILGARSLALVSPYPADLTALAHAYWTRRGFEVREVVSPEPAEGAHPIYGLTASAMKACALRVTAKTDAVLMMGTGAPSLPVIRADGPPTVSSNFCLGWRVQDLLTPGGLALDRFSGLDAPWRARLRERFPTVAG